MNSKKQSSRYMKERSAILFEITALVLIVFLIAGILSYVFLRSSLNRLISKSKDKVVEAEANLIMSSHDFISSLIIDIQKLSGVYIPDPDRAEQELIEYAAKGELSPIQEIDSDILKSMVDSNLLGINLAIQVIPASPPTVPYPVILFSSDKNLIYEELPDEIADMEELGDSYELLEGGVPEFGLEGEYLVTSYSFTPYEGKAPLYYLSFKPMEEELDSIDSFYESERRHIYSFLGTVVGGSIFALTLITFFVLSFLIRRRITKPIDELSEAAERVMDGELDLEVPVKKGEEFEGLKNAFNEMLRSLREIITRSTDK